MARSKCATSTAAVSLVPWVIAAIVAVETGCARRAPAAVAYPDIQVMVPTSEISIGHPTQQTREFRFSHITWNGGAGPMEIRPDYNSVTGTAQPYQRLYTYDASGNLQLVSELPMATTMVFDAPADYRFPLSSFGLYAVGPGNSVGALVAPSPKVDFCISEDYFVVNLPHTPSSPQHSCGTTNLLGLAVGWGDKYDYTDAGENIDLTGVPDGTYWLRAIADPFHYLAESDTSNNITDTEVTISGGTVTIVGQQTHPNSTPPSVSLTAPAAGAMVSGVVTISATADASVNSVVFLVDGQPIGSSGPPYSIQWNTASVSTGNHFLSAQATNASGFVGTASVVTVTVAQVRANSPTSTATANATPGVPTATPTPMTCFIVDVSVSVNGRNSVTTPSFHTALPGELLLAFVASDGPASGGQTATVSGAGLTWTLVKRANSQLGTAEIWQATAASVVTGTVSSTQANTGYDQSLTVVAIQGTDGIGASAAAGAASGAPAVSLVTTGAGSLLFGVGNDWENAIPRTLGLNQIFQHEWVDTGVNDTYWVQNITQPTGPAGSVATLNDTAPTSDRWNFAAVEVRGDDSSAPCGNGIVEPGEQCDDGAKNGAAGDCCSAGCQFEPTGTSCDDGNACTVGETCNGAGTCGGFTSCRVNSTCNVCGQTCTQPQPGVCKCG